MQTNQVNDEWAEFGTMLAKHIKRLDKRCADLELKLTRLEATLEHRNFAYQGVWKDGKIYNPGSFVTHSGAIWHSNVFHNKTRPGDGDANWTLACKAARDGRDGKDARGAA